MDKNTKNTVNSFCAIATHCFIISLSHYQPQRLDFNPQLWEDELSVLPLYQYRWHVTIKFSRGGERTWDLLVVLLALLLSYSGSQITDT